MCIKETIYENNVPEIFRTYFLIINHTYIVNKKRLTLDCR